MFIRDVADLPRFAIITESPRTATKKFEWPEGFGRLAKSQSAGHVWFFDEGRGASAITRMESITRTWLRSMLPGCQAAFKKAYNQNAAEIKAVQARVTALKKMNENHDELGRFSSSPGGGASLSPEAHGIMEKYKNEQAWKEPIKEFMEANGLKYEDHLKADAALYAHNVTSEGESSTAKIKELWASDAPDGRALRAMSAWNEWQVVNVLKPPASPVSVDSIKEDWKRSQARGSTWENFARSKQSGEFFTGPDAYFKHLEAVNRGETVFYRKGTLDRAVVSTTLNSGGARSGSSYFKPDHVYSYSQMKEAGYHLLSGVRGMVGVTSAQEGEAIWLKPPEPVTKADTIAKASSDEEWLRQLAADTAEAFRTGNLKVFVEDAGSVLADTAKDSSRRVVASFGAYDANLVNRADESGAEWARQHAAQLVGQHWEDGRLVPSNNPAMRIDETTRAMVREIIYQRLMEGADRDELVADLVDSNAFSERRAQLIADTEIRHAHSQGALHGANAVRRSGVRVKKYWMVADRPCPICEENADEGEIELEEEFPSGDMTPPGHPNCRCALGTVAGARVHREPGEVDPDPGEVEHAPAPTAPGVRVYG